MSPKKRLRVVTETKADATIALGGGSTTGLGKAIALRTDLPQIVLRQPMQDPK